MIRLSRMPINGDSNIIVNDIKIKIKEYIGEGSTCLAYWGELKDGTKVIVKELYPDIPEIERNPQTSELKVYEPIRNSLEYQAKKIQFKTGYEKQKELAINSDAMEIVVNPKFLGSYGDTIYSVSDAHNGMSLDKVHLNTISEKLQVAMRVIEMFGILHKAGYVMTDFKLENILFIPQLKGLKLIDMDSIVSLEGKLDGGIDRIWTNVKFRPPEINQFMECILKGLDIDDKKESYLIPEGNVYSLGVFLFELLLGRPYSIREPQRNLVSELFRKYREELKGKDNIKKCVSVMYKALEEDPDDRFVDGYEMLDALLESAQKIIVEQYKPKKVIAEGNYTYLVYNLLEENPLYNHIIEVDGIKRMQTLVYGNHSLRKYYLKAAISTAQMFNTELHVYIVSEDVEEFWTDYTSTQENPELSRTVIWDKDGNFYNSQEDIIKAKIVETPLAYIHLYSNESDVSEIIRKNKISHILFLDEHEMINKKLVQNTPVDTGNFVGYLSNQKEENEKGYPISVERMTDEYDEKVFKKKIFKMGYYVHKYYFRSNHAIVSDEEIYNDYKSNFYYIENSERSALHAIYKLKSVNIDHLSQDASDEFDSRIMNNDSEEGRKMYEELIALEHRSWTAFMVLSGAKAIDEISELYEYAFDGENDWKDMRDKRHIKHPCLRASRAGRALTEEIWRNRNNLSETDIKLLDPLDRRSLEIYQAINKMAEERIDLVRTKINIEMKFYMSKTDEKNKFEKFKQLADQIFDVVNYKNVNDNISQNDQLEIKWKNVVAEMMGICKKSSRSLQELEALIQKIDHLMKPVLWSIKYHDFKQGDVDVLDALAFMLREQKVGCLIWNKL